MERLEVPAGSFRFTALAAGPQDGRLVLLLHGFPQAAIEWEAQLDALGAAGYRAIAPDQRGYAPGARPEGVEAYGLTHLASDVLAIADWVGGHRFDLVGHDWGAAVAWYLAATAPDRLRTLTAVSVPHPAAFSAAIDGDSEQREKSSYIELFRRGEAAERLLLADGAARLRALYDGGAVPATSVDAYVERLSEPGALTAALNWYRAMRRDEWAAIGPVEVPTLYVWSTADQAISRAAADACEAHVRGPYRFEALDGISHWVPEQAPDALNSLLLEHLGAH